MDLSVLEKKAFFIPTPGQYEQEYLAKRMSDLKMAPYCVQEAFNHKKLEEIGFYNGIKSTNSTIDFEDLFSLFKSKGKL
jgi:hypothetical protein